MGALGSLFGMGPAHQVQSPRGSAGFNSWGSDVSDLARNDIGVARPQGGGPFGSGGPPGLGGGQGGFPPGLGGLPGMGGGMGQGGQGMGGMQQGGQQQRPQYPYGIQPPQGMQGGQGGGQQQQQGGGGDFLSSLLGSLGGL